MRIVGLALLFVAAISLAGCATKKTAAPARPAAAVFSPLPGVAMASNAPAPGQPLTITPERGLNGKIVSVDNAARFVVVGFPGGRLPPQDLRFTVYRQGLKVGQIKISGPQLNLNIVADLTDGEAQAGDDVREN